MRVGLMDYGCMTSDESRTECVETWSSYDNGRQLIPGYYCAW